MYRILAAGDHHISVLIQKVVLTRIGFKYPITAGGSGDTAIGKLFAGELRMTGGSGKQYDSARSAWVESVSFTIRGAERFTTED